MADDELLRYIQEMIDMMNTEDEELNERNKQLLVDQIAKKIKERGVKAEREQISQFLEELRKDQLSSAHTAEERKKILNKMTEGFYTLGYMGYYAQSQSQCATAALQLGLQGGSLETLT